MRPLRVRFDLVVGVLVGCLALAADILAVFQRNSTSSNCLLAGSVVELVAMTFVLLFDVWNDMWYPNSAWVVMESDEEPSCPEPSGAVGATRAHSATQNETAITHRHLQIAQKQALATIVKLICQSNYDQLARVHVATFANTTSRNNSMTAESRIVNHIY